MTPRFNNNTPLRRHGNQPLMKSVASIVGELDKSELRQWRLAHGMDRLTDAIIKALHEHQALERFLRKGFDRPQGN